MSKDNGSRNMTPKTRTILWAKSAGRCQFQNCNKPLIGDLVSGNRKLNSGYVAHVIADSPAGPRGDAVESPKRANDPDNVMLLCDAHHREIDKENPALYPAARLFQMKQDQEEWVATVLSSGPDSRSHVLQFSATIGKNETAIPMDECVSAMLPEKTPASERPLELKIRGTGLADNDPEYWSLEIRRLRQGFDEQVKGRIERGEIRNLSIFGFAPMPLLMELGRLIPDIVSAQVYQRHRHPHASWKWANDKPPIGLTLKPGLPGPKQVALKLSITASIADERIQRVLGDRVSIWEITCDRPTLDNMRRPDDLALFRTLAWDAFEKIKRQHGEDAVLSVFPAAPVSCAIEFGRAWQPKAHLPMDVYDQAPGDRFLLRHRIS